jgi:hypothetical protein
VLRLRAEAFDLGRVLVERVNAFLATHPTAEEALKRVLTLRLATVREDGEPTRRRALRSEFSDEEWQLVSELADHPSRLLVTATPEGGHGQTYAEVAHEAIFRRWEKLKEWIAEEKDFLIRKSVLEADRRAWEAQPANAKSDALLMGFKLTLAQTWLAERAQDLATADRQFIALSGQSDRKARARAWRAQAAIYVLPAAIIVSLLGVIFKEEIGDLWFEQTAVRSYIAANFKEHGLKLEAERGAQTGRHVSGMRARLPRDGRRSAGRVLDGIARRRGLYQRISPPQSEDRQAVRGRQVRDDLGRLGSLRRNAGLRW